MTKRDKIIIFCSIAIALCLIIGTVCIIRFSNVNYGFLPYSLPIILISLFAVFTVYFSKIRKGKYEKMLNSEYYPKYEIIRDIVINSQLANNRKKEIKDDILDILISAQKAGKNVDDAVGSPVEFAENIIKAYLKPGRIAVLTLLDGIMYSTIFILLVSCALWLENVRVSFFTTGMDIDVLFIILFVAFIIIPTSKAFYLKQNISTYTLPLIIIIAFILLLGIISKIFGDNVFVMQLDNGRVYMIPNMIIFIIYLVVIPICLFLKAHARRIS